MEASYSYKNSNLLRMADIHKTATVHPEARIARDVEIGPYTIIGSNVEISGGTKIGPHVIIEGSTVIGKNNNIYHGAALGIKPDNLKDSIRGCLLIGDNNTIRENVTINSGTEEKNTIIGSNNFIMAYCHIACNCKLGDNIIISNAVNLGKEVVIEDKAVIAGISSIEDHVKIGKIAMVGAHSRISDDVPPYILVDGHQPMRVKVNVIGLRRNGFQPELRKKIKKIYKLVFRSGLARKTAIKAIEREVSAGQLGGEIEYFLDFIKNTEKNKNK